MEARRLGIQRNEVLQGQMGFRRLLLAVPIRVQFTDAAAIGQLELVQAAIWLKSELDVELREVGVHGYSILRNGRQQPPATKPLVRAHGLRKGGTTFAAE